MSQAPGSSHETPVQAPDDQSSTAIGRMFLFEPGWKVGVKSGSHREFCYTMAPGQDFYHRLLDGEIFLVRADERLCLACAARRGLIALEPKRLRDTIRVVSFNLETLPLELDWRDRHGMTDCITPRSPDHAGACSQQPSRSRLDFSGRYSNDSLRTH